MKQPNPSLGLCLKCGRADGVLRSRYLVGPICQSCYEKHEMAQGFGGAYATRLGSIQRQRVEWLWPDRIPSGMLTLLIGDPGLGKSLFSLYIAGIVTATGSDVLIVSAEDHPAATIRPRAEAVGADVDRLHVVGVRREGIEDGLLLPDDAEDLDQLVRDLRAKLVIVDPLMAHLADNVNSWRDQSIRRALAPLHQTAHDRKCAVLVVAHLNKAKGSDALYRTGGSIGVPAAVRSALLLARDPDDPDGEIGSQRVIAHVKCNVAEQAPSLAAVIESVVDEDIETAKIRITGTSTTTATDLLDVETADEKTERDEAVEYLLAELADGPRPAADLNREAPCGKRTLSKAKKTLGVISEKQGFNGAWSWRLPDGEDEAKDAPAKDAGPISPPVQPSQIPLDDAVSNGASGRRLQGCTDTDDGAAFESASDGDERPQGYSKAYRNLLEEDSDGEMDR